MAMIDTNRVLQEIADTIEQIHQYIRRCVP
jgi:hypothetical protein